MPYSYSLYKKEYKDHLIQKFEPFIHILDVGAGSGNYGHLLREHFPNIDGIEIHNTYFEMFNLEGKYRHMFLGDILSFDWMNYDYLILGDIIEHLDVKDAQNLLNELHMNDKYFMVSVPYMMQQGIEYNNLYEVHIQDDLTHEIVLERYPMLKLLWKDSHYGYYTNY